MNVVSEFLQNLKTRCGNTWCYSPYLQLYCLLASFVVKVERDKNAVFFFSVIRMIPFFVKQACAFFIYYFYYKLSVYLSKMMNKKLTKKVKSSTLFLSVLSAIILAVNYAFGKSGFPHRNSQR